MAYKNGCVESARKLPMGIITHEFRRRLESFDKIQYFFQREKLMDNVLDSLYREVKRACVSAVRMRRSRCRATRYNSGMAS